LAQEVTADLEEYLDKGRGTVAPWAKARIFASRIRRNIKLAECPGFGQSIFQYAPKCPGADDYKALASEVLQTPALVAARVAVDGQGQVSVVQKHEEQAPAEEALQE
jgi:chromosome partitioning protein